jgi:soluble lytic murein transglycosylase-like protein
VPAPRRQRFARSSALVALAGAALVVVAHTASAHAEKPATRTHAHTAVASARGEKICPLPDGLRPAFVRASRDTGLPLSLLVAVARVESNLRADAISERGARGLLQLMPATAASLRLDPDDPAANVLAGARYLRRLLDRFPSADTALAAYNAGPTAVDRAGGAPTGETLTYVANVDALWRALEGCT